MGDLLLQHHGDQLLDQPPGRRQSHAGMSASHPRQRLGLLVAQGVEQHLERGPVVRGAQQRRRVRGGRLGDRAVVVRGRGPGADPYACGIELVEAQQRRDRGRAGRAGCIGLLAGLLPEGQPGPRPRRPGRAADGAAAERSAVDLQRRIRPTALQHAQRAGQIQHLAEVDHLLGGGRSSGGEGHRSIPPHRPGPGPASRAAPGLGPASWTRSRGVRSWPWADLFLHESAAGHGPGGRAGPGGSLGA